MLLSLIIRRSRTQKKKSFLIRLHSNKEEDNLEKLESIMNKQKIKETQNNQMIQAIILKKVMRVRIKMEERFKRKKKLRMIIVRIKLHKNMIHLLIIVKLEEDNWGSKMEYRQIDKSN